MNPLCVLDEHRGYVRGIAWSSNQVLCSLGEDDQMKIYTQQSVNGIPVISTAHTISDM